MSTVTVSEIDFDVIEYVAPDENGVLHSVSEEHPEAKPLANIPMMSDYKWQLSCLNDRLEHPEEYEGTEDVQQTIAELRKWLAEHTPI